VAVRPQEVGATVEHATERIEARDAQPDLEHGEQKR
jgi:hypothetical protein